ncbi:MAG: flagellar biosynthesis protein FlhA [Deltaproteobacteria bacterium]|nr:MAG: flagellar biosynthesis protein FlhA [Deltaproteobacteria bacterium]
MAVGVLGLLLIMVIPLPQTMMDVLLALNITLSIIIMLTAIYTLQPLDFYLFPTILLVTTLFRLSLNVATTRLILLHGHEGALAAGKVIRAFGHFVVGGNYLVGMVVFVILVIVNFVVITKGTERIAEVAARFTLDSMPGKQMSIDADLNAGLIGEDEARKRREEIAREADFYGTMDGASKFVRGDAIAGILITLVNIFGGLLIGVLQNHMDIHTALQNYTLLTVGDGLVSQIPALIISTSAGVVMSRAASGATMGKEFAKQFSFQPRLLIVGALIIFGISLIPGFPFLPFFLLAVLLAGLGHVMQKARTEKTEKETTEEEEAIPEDATTDRYSLLPSLDMVELEVGFGLIPLVDENQSGDLLHRIRIVRQQLAQEMGFVIPPIHIRDNLKLEQSEYRILLKGTEIGRGKLMLGYLLAINPGDATEEVEGIPTREPTFNLPALWIEESKKEEAINRGYSVVDPSAVITTHVTELLKQHADELLTRQDVQHMLDHLAASSPKVVEELNEVATLGIVQKVLQNLLRENVPIRDLLTIAEAIADYAQVTKDPEVLTEYVRQRLSRSITRPLEDSTGTINVITLDPELENKIAQGIQKSEHGSYLVLDPEFIQKILTALNDEIMKLVTINAPPVILCSPLIRRHLRKLLERFMPEAKVISHAELTNHTQIKALGIVRLNDAN